MPEDRLGTPDILLMVSEEVLVFDNLAGTIRLVVNADPAHRDALSCARARLDELVLKLRQPVPPLPDLDLAAAGSAELEKSAASDFTQAMYETSVERIKEYVLAGDVMQVVPSQRMSIPFADSAAQPLSRLCVTSTRRLICFSWISMTFMSSGPPRRFSLASSRVR